MYITLTDETDIALDVVSSPVELVLRSMLKNLQHVPVPFRDWDNPYYQDTVSYEELVDQLDKFASKLDIVIDQSKCLARDDKYLNELHRIYEVQYNGNPNWLDFHETIHLCQRFFYPRKNYIAFLDWREKAGPLLKKFEPQWSQYRTTQLTKGDVYLEWSELGKTPYTYWREQEPNDLARLNELAKPWLNFRPKLAIAMHDMNLLDGYKVVEFSNWWKDYQESWCKNWNLTEWTLEDIHSGIVVYKVRDISQFELALKQKTYPRKISL
jgi:hypothetical protein